MLRVYEEKHERFTITSDLILTKTITTLTATCIRTSSIMTVLTTIVNSCLAFIDIWIWNNDIHNITYTIACWIKCFKY